MKKSSKILGGLFVACMVSWLISFEQTTKQTSTTPKVVNAVKKQAAKPLRPAALKEMAVPTKKISGITASASVAYDMVTNRYLYGKNVDKTMYSASTTKLMALYLALKKLHKDATQWQTKVTIDAKVAKMSQSYYAGEVPLVEGEQLTVRQLFDNALVGSSNESITALGIWLAGSNRAMIKQMNQQAKKWSLSHTKYYSVSGLDNADLVPFGLNILKATANNKNTSSPRDLIVIADQLITEYPEILKHAQLKNTTTRGFKLPTTNQMLKGEAYYKPKFGIDGLKTGTTPAAGEVFVATAQAKKHHRVITVVMHSKNRFEDTAKILDNIYAETSYK